ncbi:glycosyltransferase [Geomonas sp. Red32]|uniref:glycosyltransferase n=1 Tax=Geomonas sp. Red32 TaxID=2912856 RepID=UPI00202CF855|nr:glycosyltransferase [Geomonas sp. Red32]MCM0083363.1 glycosyltransferase [Geomonas sp. Red32]
MKTLIMTAHYPLPECTGSDMRTMNFARYFKRHGVVDILCKKSDRCPASPGGSGFFRRGFYIDFTGNERRSFAGRVADKLVHLKSWATAHYTADSEREIRSIVEEGEYDVVLCRYLTQAYPLLRLSRRLRGTVILDVDDIVLDSVYDAETSHLTGLARIGVWFDRFTMARFYARCMHFGRTLFCSEGDRSKLARGRSAAHAHVVPNVCPEPAVPNDYRQDGFDRLDRLLFVGSLSYAPNAQGAAWFIEEILPVLTGEFPHLALVVAGRNPQRELIELIERTPQAELHADVPDLTPLYESCGAAVVPLRAGGGTRIKILEAGFMKRPVFSTAVGAYGLGLTEGEDVMHFEDAAGFLKQYQHVASDRKLYGRLAEGLSAKAEEYGVESFCRSMDRILAGISGVGAGDSFPVHCHRVPEVGGKLP